ncbi:MAG TPA: hypothetical protein VGV59_11975 [Pyrinomonadaceae bacterium]|nr:hypothetical protein [Pyrinomonadaceae bacterium]
MRLWKKSESFPAVAAAVALAALFGAACQQEPVTNSNTTTTTTNVNSNTNTNVSVTTATTASGKVIETREPERYSARLVITAEPEGQRPQEFPGIEIARNGADRRYAFDSRLPGVGQVIFLDKADKRYVIIAGRRQYAELTPDMTGFTVPRSMTPGEMVSQLERQQGVERLGEEQRGDRTVVKYRYTGQAQTNTQAGQVSGESFIYIDKETGLPVRIEGFGQSSGNVQGVNRVKAVAELRDIKTEVDPSLFELPTDYRKLTPEEVRQQLSFVASIIGAFVNSMNAQAGGGASTSAPTTAPTTGASPTASPAH